MRKGDSDGRGLQGGDKKISNALLKPPKEIH